MIKNMVSEYNNDIWEAIRSIRVDIAKLKKADEDINAEFLIRSYNSIIEKLELMQKDIDSIKK